MIDDLEADLLNAGFERGLESPKRPQEANYERVECKSCRHLYYDDMLVDGICPKCTNIILTAGGLNGISSRHNS